MANNFTFSENQFNRIFPYYILINQDMVIESNGTSLDKVQPGTKGKPFSESFKIKQPYIKALDFETLKSKINHPLEIECFNDEKTNLSGQIDYLQDTNQLLFLGNTLQVETQKKEVLNKEIDEIHELALFTYQNPDPNIRINFNGEVLLKNPAAVKLEYYIYDEKLYRNEEFFKLIASKIDLNLDILEFEAISGNIEYSFVCIPSLEERHINIYGRNINQSKKDQLHLEHLYLIIQQTKQSIVLTDAKGKIVWVNNSFEKITGYSTEEVKGKTPGSIMQGKDSDPETIQYMRRKIHKGRSFSCEIYNYTKSKVGFWVRINAQPVFDKKGNLVQYFAIQEDITLEKKSQKEFQEAINRMTSLITNLHAGVLLVNEYGKIDLANNRFCKIFDIIEDTSVLIGTESAKTIDNAKQFFKDPDQFVSNIKHYKEAKKLVTGEILEMIDGRFFERDFIPIWNGNTFNGNLWVYTEITEKINADKKLEDQKVFYEEILDNIPADIAVFDNQHHYLYVNPKGISDPILRKWLIGKKDEDYVRVRNKSLSIVRDRRKLFNEVMKSKALKSWEEDLKQADGFTHYVLRNMYPVLNNEGQVKLIIGYGVDITYTKSVLLQIEESEKRYRDVIENAQALITTHDMTGKILTANPIVGKTYGYHEDEFIGHFITEFMPEEERVFFNDRYMLKIKTEKKIGGTFKVVNKNGSITHTLFNNFLKEEPGKEPYVIGFAVDITNRVKAEEELKKAQNITEELARTKQNFLANMSHEIRTPMNAIMGMTNQLSKTALNKDQHYYLDIIQNASSNLLHILNEILDLSKIEAGKLSLENIGFEPKLIISQVMQVMKHKSEEKGLLFTNSFCDLKLADVLMGDPYRLNQIMLNLISNAIKFTENGSVDIGCKVITEDELQQTVRVSIKDTGIGMAESFTKNLFKKYAQEEGSISRIYGGTGLGMSICEELVHLMNGNIFVESKKGIGTTVSFEISFGKGTKDQIPVKEITQLDTSILKGRKVLITDDYEINRLVASTILNDYDVITVEAKNGIEAIEKIENETFDVVLMDVQMPEMDGIEATQIIRNKISKTIPIIALTAYALKGDDAKFIDAGMNDYLSKPFEENQLLEILIRWIKKTAVNLPTEFIKPKAINKPIVIASVNSAPLFDLTKIKDIARGNNEFVNKMIALFIESTPVSVIEMRNAYTNNEFEKVRKIAHRIKPSIDNLEITSLKIDIREIELNAETFQKSAQLDDLILKVEKTMNEVVFNLRQIV
jgi:PAS domain S-box-containing protein